MCADKYSPLDGDISLMALALRCVGPAGLHTLYLLHGCLMKILQQFVVICKWCCVWEGFLFTERAPKGQKDDEWKWQDHITSLKYLLWKKMAIAVKKGRIDSCSQTIYMFKYTFVFKIHLEWQAKNKCQRLGIYSEPQHSGGKMWYGQHILLKCRGQTEKVLLDTGW